VWAFAATPCQSGYSCNSTETTSCSIARCLFRWQSLCALVCNYRRRPWRAGDDPKEILRRALNVNSHNHELALAYTYVERDEQRTLDKAGAVAQRKSTTGMSSPCGGIALSAPDPARRQAALAQEEQQQAAARQKQEAERQRIRRRATRRHPSSARSASTPKSTPASGSSGKSTTLSTGSISVWRRRTHRWSARMGDRGCHRSQATSSSPTIWPRPRQDEGPRLDRERRLSAGQNRRGNHRQHLVWRWFSTPQQRHAVHLEYIIFNGEVWLPKHMAFSASGRVLSKACAWKAIPPTATTRSLVDSRIVSNE